MATWNKENFGCIDRDSFRLRPVPRTAVTKADISPILSRKADVSAPLEASFSATQTDGQYRAFTQWHLYDLSNGARPFSITLYVWGKNRTMRARFLGAWEAQRLDYDVWQTTGSFEIERESITP